MMNYRTFLLASAAVVGLGYSSSPAMAFDEVNWVWNKEVLETVIKDVNVQIDTQPTGMTEIEKLQIQIGDVTATSSVSDINNNAPGIGESGQAFFSETLDLDATFDDNAADNPITDVTFNSPLDLDVSNPGGSVDSNSETVSLTFDVEGFLDVQLDGERDAIDLPEVESIATAIGNNQSIYSEVSTQLHDAQILVGDFNQDSGFPQASLEDTGNLHTDLALAAGLSGALGLINPASVTATSDVTNITNAYVDSAATAVGNNMDVELEAASAADAFLIGDITQFSYANLNAMSTVNTVDVNNYGNMAALEVPLVSSVATAIGNNVNISVSSPLNDTPVVVAP